MMTARLGTIATVACLLVATPALARSYDCADAQDSGAIWEPSEAQENLFLEDRNVLPDVEDFMYRYCGRIEDGKNLIMVGALHVVDDWAICDDEANYAIFYDPETRKFGEPIPHQKLCGHGMKLRRPGT